MVHLCHYEIKRNYLLSYYKTQICAIFKKYLPLCSVVYIFFNLGLALISCQVMVPQRFHVVRPKVAQLFVLFRETKNKKMEH